MPLFGNIVVIKRNGTDGISFPLTASSCLFGRRTECDIRIQLPQVSKEHCKIEVNENKEAILTNLSTVNPTQLNGGCFQQPVPLKHGDVLTIIDRSFRFEYPLQSTPRKKRSRSPKDETLQVLHVQQVAEVELLHQQTPGSKSLHASDTAECEGKKATENKQCTEGNISKALPIQLQTPKSSRRVQQSVKQYEMSPFTKLYEKLKHDIKMDKSLQERNRAQQAAKEGSKSVLLEPSAQISSSSGVYDLGSLTKEKDIGRNENKEDCKIEQRVIRSEFNQLSGGGSAARGFTTNPQSSASKKMSRDAVGRSHLQVHKDLSTANKSTGMEVTTKPSKGNDGNAAFSQQLCSIQCLDYADNMKVHSCAVAVNEPAQTGNGSEVDKYILSTPTPRRKSSHFLSPTKETSGMNPVTADTPKTGRRVSLKRRSLTEIAAGAQREDLICRNDNPEQLPLAENKCLKQRRNSKQHTPGTPGKVLKEISDQASFVTSQEGHSESPASLLSSKSPRRNNRQSKELSKSVPSEMMASEKLAPELASAGQKADSGRKRGRRRTSGSLTDKALETNASEEHKDKTTDRKDSGIKEELAIKEDGQKQDLEDASVLRPHRLSPRGRSSGSTTVLKDTEAVSETNVSGLLAGEESGKTKRNSQKRSGDMLLQPLGKRKRVSFGGHLSPELFDKSLPPNSPLKRGAIPARLSLPFGNSPRAVLKKAQGLKHFAVQELSEHSQKEKVSPKNVSSRKSPAASPPASGKTTPKPPSGSPAPYTKGRFSVSRVTAPLPIAEEKDPLEEDVDMKEKNDAQVQTPTAHTNQDGKTFLTPTHTKPRRSAKLPLKATPVKRRSGSMAVRKSGASSANLLVAKSWAEVVKLGVARPQSKTVKKRVRKGRRVKKRTQSPKTPVRKIKGHFSTGHAESPATIVVGRAYSTTVRTSGRVPKVVKNTVVKLNMNMDESFTGMPEMFQTPENQSGKPLAAVQKTDFTPTCSALEMSDLQTPEESGEMMVSPLNNSDASEPKQDNPGICHLLREEESLKPLKSVFAARATKTPENQKATLQGSLTGESLSTVPEQQASQKKSRSKRRTPKQKLEPAEVVSGIKQLLRTPKQRSEPVEDLSGVKELMKTPKQKLELVEALSGIKQLLRTPKRRSEPVEALSGVKELMKTPKKKLEPVEVLSGIKQLMRTPQQKPEPVEVLSGIKQLMRTPQQKPEPVEVLSGIKQLMRTPQQKPEPVEVLSGIKQLMKTPQQKPEPVEVLSGIKQLMKTPQQKPEPVEVLSGIKQLMKTPQQELEPVLDEIAFKRLLKTPGQETEAVKDMAGVAVIKKTPKMKSQPVEDMIGVSRIFKTPKDKVEPIEDMFGISRLVRTPRQKHQPTDDFVGLQKLLAEHKQKHPDAEVDYLGVKEMFDVPEEMKITSVNAVDSQQDDTAPSCSNSSHKCEDKGNTSHGNDPQQKESTVEDQPTQRPTRSRARRTVYPASAKQCEMNLSLKELQSTEKKSTQEEIGEISTSGAKSKGRGRRVNRCIEVISNQEKVETVSLVEPHGAAQRPGRGKRKEPKEVKPPSENPQSCGNDSSVQQKEPANTEQALQVCDIKMLETEGGATVKTGVVSSGIENENCQLQAGVQNPENKSNEGGVENSKEELLSPWKRSGGAREVESTEPVIPPKRERRARNVQVQQAAVKDLRGTARKLRTDPSAKVIQGHEQAAEQNAALPEGSGSGTKPEGKITEGRARSLRSARKHSPEVKTNTCVIVLENMQNTQKTEEESGKGNAGTQPHLKREIKVSLGDETAQENTTETSQRLKAESPSGETNKRPVAALSLETSNAVQEPRRARNRRGKKASLENQAAEFTRDANNLELITPRVKPEREMDESSPKDSLSSVSGVKDQNNPAGTSVPAEDSDSLPHSRPKRARNEQGILKARQTAVPQVNQAQNKATACRRGRGRKVLFELEEASSKVVSGESILPGGDKGGQHETSENPTSQVRRSRRKQGDPIPQTACPTFVGKPTLIAEHCNNKASENEQDAAMEAAPSSTEDNPRRQGKRREVAAAPRASRSLSVRRRGGLLEGEDEKMTVREDPALGNKTLQAKGNAPARGRRKKIDLAVEAKSSSLQRKRGLSETDDKEESTNEEQNMPLETVSCAEEKPLGRGRRKETAPASQTTNNSSLRGKRGLPANSDREGAPEEDGSVPNQLRKSRRKGIAIFSEAPGPTSEGKQGLSKESGRKNDGEARQLSLENSNSQEKKDLPKRSSRQTVSSLAVSSTSLQGLPEDGKNETPEQQESVLLEVVPSAKENPSRVGRKKTTSKPEETSSASLREKPGLAKDRGQKKILKVSEDASLENKLSQEKPRQLRNKRKKVEFALEAATSPGNDSDLPGRGNALEAQTGCLASAGSEENDPSGKEEANPAPQPPPTAHRRKRQLPADGLASKKLRSENDANKTLEKGKRNKSKEECDKEAARATLTAGGMERKTRSNTRTSARTRR